ncbi:D-inositol-3-phosphate glycosyltransferase [Candidatus Magnetaquicoccaceae bacterium FCR-1]|uniref:D-inositol-3-phosphate glycosyltransferase n=1 Tax=Candidatus Magnetaquiglobus chichijimensis TaxID=3141448 RepID=A0ABQ0C5Z6_9PROT
MNTPLKILHTESSLGWGGQELRILTESLGMMKRGLDLRLLTPREATIFQEAQKRGLPVEAVPIARKNLPGLITLRERIQTLQPDVIITHSSTDSWLTALATRFLANRPALIRLRHISAPVPVNPANRWLYGTASLQVVTTGEGIRERLIRINHIPADQVHSIPTGIDLARFSPGDRQAARVTLGLPAEIPIIGIVATLRSWKGHHDLIDAFARLNHPRALLVIVGDGPREEFLKQRIAALGLSPERVRMTGRQENVPLWLRALDLFVLPSLANEGVPQALIQAMATALPIVSTPIGGIPEMIESGVSGVLVTPGDVPALSAAMGSVLENPSGGRALGMAALEVARARCSTETMLDRMEGVIQEALRRRDRRR